MQNRHFEIVTNERDEKVFTPFPLPAGVFLSKILNVESRKSQSGNSFLLWTMLVIRGAYAGITFTFSTTLIEGKRWSLALLMKALNIQRIDDQFYSFDTDEIIERKVFVKTIAVKKGEYTNIEVKSFYSHTEDLKGEMNE